MMKAKICGLTRVEDAADAMKLGAWALGFNFYSGSKRYISPNKARELLKLVNVEVKTVGLFVNTDYATVSGLKDDLNLDFVQIYGSFDAPIDFMRKYVIMPLGIDSISNIPDDIDKYAYIMIDVVPNDNNLGGTGKLANWDVARELAGRAPLILAGGLTPDNLVAAIEYVRPVAVDVASGVELSPGVKDSERLRKFLEICNDKKRQY